MFEPVFELMGEQSLRGIGLSILVVMMFFAVLFSFIWHVFQAWQKLHAYMRDEANWIEWILCLPLYIPLCLITLAAFILGLWAIANVAGGMVRSVLGTNRD